MKIKYPYIPKGKEIKYLPGNNRFMKLAREKGEKSGCRKQPTGAVIAKNGKVVAEGSNSGIRVEICPRVLRHSKTGTDYQYCKDLCKQGGHAEAMAVADAKNKEINISGADLYLWGHWWCCEPCWNSMTKAGIRDVYLEKGSENTNQITKKAYISGALTRLDGKKDYRHIYEMIAMICSDNGMEVYLPHIFSDPVKNPEISPAKVWEQDHRNVSSSDLIIAYVGQPSHGVGAELEIARVACKDIILWYFEGEKVSRMVLGNPAVQKTIVAKDENDIYRKLIKYLKERKI